VALPLALGAVAMLLRTPGEPAQPPVVEHEEPPTVAAPIVPAPEPSPARRLWAEPVNDASTRAGRLWSR
jgi:hypothetical protein